MVTRTRKKGIPVDAIVESSALVNLRPRGPKLRHTPPRGTAPLQKKPTRKKIPFDERTGTGARTKRSQMLREQRETISAEIVQEAAVTGMLPHEWLLAVMRGEQLNHYAYDSETQEIIEVIVLPTFVDRMEAAKAAAPYFANKLNNTGPKSPFGTGKAPGVMEVPLAESMAEWQSIAGPSQAKLKREVTK